VTSLWLILPEHGEYDQQSKKWFCSYWMAEEEWMDLHHYFPANKLENEKEKNNDEL
jgi:hypothetical protein